MFPLGPKANLFLTARPNSETNGTRSLSLGLLTPILIILAVMISSSCSGDSGGTATKSSLAEITKLTVTINGNDYSITFDANNAATVTIPYGSTLPTEITVTSADISAKATGLAAGDTLKISSGKADITITAEDGTTTAHTLNVEISPLKLTNQELGDRWGLFQVVLDEEDTLYHFGVIPAGEQVPEKSEMESDLNVKKYIVGRNPINIILATTMKSPLLPFFDAVTDNASAKAIWTDTDVSFNGANIMKGDNEFAAKRSLLAPETAHKVYALEDGGNSVHIIHEFTTAAVDLTTDSSTLGTLSSTLQAETLTFHVNNYEVFPLQMKASLASDTALLMSGTALHAFGQPMVYWDYGALALNPAIFPKDNRPEFYFYAGEAVDYGNSPRLLSLRGLFMTVKGWTNANPVFPLEQVHQTEGGSAQFTPTINYQQ